MALATAGGEWPTRKLGDGDRLWAARGPLAGVIKGPTTVAGTGGHRYWPAWCVNGEGYPGRPVTRPATRPSVTAGWGGRVRRPVIVNGGGGGGRGATEDQFNEELSWAVITASVRRGSGWSSKGARDPAGPRVTKLVDRSRSGVHNIDETTLQRTTRDH